MTDEVRRASGTLHHLTGDIAEVIRRILSDRPHLLVFLEVGLDARTTQVAGLRLAPVQCTAWDQPITSGMQTLDYFLSSRMMEPDDAQKYYTEELIQLPGLGVCFQNPMVPKVLLKRSREEFGVREDAVVYLCCQSANKLLPSQDAVFAEIVKRVPDSQFVFLTKNELVGRALRTRLNTVFTSAGLLTANWCVILPETNRFKYRTLNLSSDVFLDTMGWSGCVSTVEAAACGLPIVTVPGRLVRGCHSYAILERLGVTETICPLREDYMPWLRVWGLIPHGAHLLLRRLCEPRPRFISMIAASRRKKNFIERLSKRSSSTNRLDQVCLAAIDA